MLLLNKHFRISDYLFYKLKQSVPDFVDIIKDTYTKRNYPEINYQEENGYVKIGINILSDYNFDRQTIFLDEVEISSILNDRGYLYSIIDAFNRYKFNSNDNIEAYRKKMMDIQIMSQQKQMQCGVPEIWSDKVIQDFKHLRI